MGIGGGVGDASNSPRGDELSYDACRKGTRHSHHLGHPLLLSRPRAAEMLWAAGPWSQAGEEGPQGLLRGIVQGAQAELGGHYALIPPPPRLWSPSLALQV